MSYDPQQRFSHDSRGRPSSGFTAADRKLRSQSQKLSHSPQTSLISNTPSNPALHSPRQQSVVVTEQTSLLHSRTSIVSSSAQDASVRKHGSGATGGTAAEPSALVLRTHRVKGVSARKTDGSLTPSAKSQYSFGCDSPRASPRDVDVPTILSSHRTPTASIKGHELSSVVSTDSPSVARRGNQQADVIGRTDSGSTKGALIGASTTGSRDAPSVMANEWPSVLNTSVHRSLRRSMLGAEKGSTRLGSAAAVALSSSQAGSAGIENIATTRGSDGGGGSSLRTYPSNTATKNTAMPPSAAHLSNAPNGKYSSSTSAELPVSSPGLSQQPSATSRTTVVGSSTDSPNMIASPRPSPHSQTTRTGFAADAPPAVSAAQGAQGVSGRDTAKSLLVTPSSSLSNTLAQPHQLLPLSDPSPSPGSQTATTTRATKNKAENAETSSDAASSSCASRPKPRPLSLQQLKPSVMTDASSSSALKSCDGPASTEEVLSLSVNQRHSAPIPLRNFGATCYLNSIVQCLLCTPGLLRALINDRERIVHEWEVEHLSPTKRASSKAHRRSCAERNVPATSSLVDLYTAHPAPPIPASKLLLNLKESCASSNDEFSSNGQKDAHEFLLTLLGVIHKEVCHSKPDVCEVFREVEDETKWEAYARLVRRLQQENNSTIYRFFGGITGCTIQCAKCHLVSYRFEAQLVISLPLTYRLPTLGSKIIMKCTSGRRDGKTQAEGSIAVDEMLREMFFSERGELLNGPMQVTCDRCKKLRDKTIWYSMEQWPPILVLHLKRFNNAGVKNESAVVFPYTFCSIENLEYQLYSVCCHRGSASFGHYTSYAYVQEEDEAAETDKNAATAATVVSDLFQFPLASMNSERLFSPRERQPTGCVGGFVTSDSISKENGTDSKGASETHRRNGNRKVNGKDEPLPEETESKTGKWYLCNDNHITEVTAPDVLSMTKEAYILFYRRVDGRHATVS
ncbi:putative ubiquitin hydrolase [Leishmania braziliensis MHOM/BR/75/M2904]|uniref:Ubiquitin hydrolase n=2 Tax=Leishmania braziliensis TaxID=5660 RepID=A4HMR5_LEIBR|nr:putative ubiquitin hydrolase [Leishmania braziliensis MHOM/BR/75/M2904]CAJ2480321.1 unnamed protein product [Leishmania braziliensis]CAM43453.2 putative ubiquitin hydrolase [Leishmania braziliensis MHOM/BR/75/M2904]SYZ69525.1 ubiquitin_hydrolase [Leishmania braziliensis MHOM/BR/75/M2904]